MSELSRRTFVQTSAAVSAAALVAGLAPQGVRAAGNERLKIGIIGCGGRGTGAGGNAMEADPAVHVVALADAFDDRLKSGRDHFSKANKARGGDAISDDHCFVGFDAYEKLLKLELDYVILATPPGFRPKHLDAAVKAGKNIFTEKPVAVDPTGIRTVMAAADAGKSKNLCIVAGTQRRHHHGYLDIMKRLQDGEIGEIVSGSAYWNQGSLWKKDRQPDWSDLEYQMRNWLYYTWLSGDHICEQHIHNLDIMNWAMGGHPVKALGMGGRQTRTEEIFGNIFDHHCIEYTYANGQRVLSMCRQQVGCSSYVGEYVRGTKGESNCADKLFKGNDTIYQHKKGPNDIDPYVQEHKDLIAAIRGGTGLNELQRVAESTFTAILGRLSTYSGKEIKWDEALKSSLNLVPDQLAFGPFPYPKVPVPGVDPAYPEMEHGDSGKKGNKKK